MPYLESVVRITPNRPGVHTKEIGNNIYDLQVRTVCLQQDCYIWLLIMFNINLYKKNQYLLKLEVQLMKLKYSLV